MPPPIRILVTGRNAPALQVLQTALTQQPDIYCSTRVLKSSGDDMLLGGPPPDIVVLRLEDTNLDDLRPWAESPNPERLPALIVVGQGTGEFVRQAFRSGARDYLAEPVRHDELVTVIRKVAASTVSRPESKTDGRITAFVGAGGGVGTSLVAANVAHMLASADQLATLLVDLDLMFAPLAHYLDLKCERGLAEAIVEQGSLDEHALLGYGSLHPSGLRLLGSRPGSVQLSQELSPERFASLLQILQRNYRHVLIDAPHHIDSLSAQVFSMSTNIYIVIQQSVLHVRNAVRLSAILRGEIGLPKDRIRLIVNRTSKNPPIELDDIRRAVDDLPLLCVPNHFKSAIESLDTGVPLLQSHATAPLTRALMEIRREIAGVTSEEAGGFLRRALPSWMRS